MKNILNNIKKEFRTAFQFPDKNLLRWFPGHMNKGLKQMQQKLTAVDCIIEVHDARIPFSGRNPLFNQTLFGIKPHILIFNKLDLIPFQKIKQIEKNVEVHGISNIIFTNCKNQKCRGVKKILPLVKQLVSSSNRYNRADEIDLSLLVIGVPNVGKSSLINILRNLNLKKANAAKVGPIAGITRSLQNKIKICDEPLIYLYDTPGILTPSIDDLESGFRLALCACLQDHLIGENLIADYLLYSLNKLQNFKYVNVLNISEPTDDINTILFDIALKNNLFLKIKQSDGYQKKIDLKLAAQIFIKHFRRGDYGTIFLDEDKLLL